MVAPSLTHARLMHFSLHRILKSEGMVTGVDFDALWRAGKEPCEACLRGGARKHAAHARKDVKYTRFGQCVTSDTLEFEASIPCGFRYLLTFLDMATKYLFVYYLRTHSHGEVKNAFVQFMADAMPWLPKRHEMWSFDSWTMGPSLVLLPALARTSRVSLRTRRICGLRNISRAASLSSRGTGKRIHLFESNGGAVPPIS